MSSWIFVNCFYHINLSSIWLYNDPEIFKEFCPFDFKTTQSYTVKVVPKILILILI
jgi:hypothetical protein